MEHNCHKCNKLFTLSNDQKTRKKSQGNCVRLFCSQECSLHWKNEYRKFDLNKKIKISCDD